MGHPLGGAASCEAQGGGSGRNRTAGPLLRKYTHQHSGPPPSGAGSLPLKEFLAPGSTRRSAPPSTPTARVPASASSSSTTRAPARANPCDPAQE